MTLSRLHPSPQIQLTYELFPNHYRRHLQAFWWYTGGVAGPLLLAHTGLWELFHLPYGRHFSLLALLGLVLYTSIRYLLHRLPKEMKTTLIVSEEAIMIRRGGEGLHKYSKRDLQLEMIGWGPCEEALLPAVRIFNGTELLLTIGAANSDVKWSNIRHTVQATDLVLSPQTDWKVFLRTLQS